MANPAKRKGTAGETGVVNYLIDQGWIHAERRALNGVNDKGDVSGIPGVVIEVKNTKTISLSQFIKEAEVEKKNANAAVGVAWIKKTGTTNPAEWYVAMTGEQFVHLLKEAGF